MAPPDEKEWTKRYYGALVGGKITKISVKEDADGLWPVLHVTLPDGHDIEVEVSKDEEGNGPGFLFGLPLAPVEDEEQEVET